MQIPVDIKAVIDEATNIDEAVQTPLSISVYMDQSAPGDVQAFVRQAVASSSPNAQVSIIYFPGFPVVAAPASDMSLIVAGFDENVGRYAQDMRDAGVPVMVVTTLPDLVSEIAHNAGHPLLEDDLIAPDRNEIGPAKDSSALSESGSAFSEGEDVSNENFDSCEEPYFLTQADRDTLNKKMGSWVIEACRDKRLAFALAFKFVRKPLSYEAVYATAAQNAGVGLIVFIPGADMPIMTLNQAKMLLQIAAAYGQSMSVDRIKELAAVVGGAFAFRSVARQLVAFVPALGWGIKAAIGYTGTVAMGCAAIEYFEADGHIGHFAEVVSRARDKVIDTADKVSDTVDKVGKQPSAKDAVKAATSCVGKNAVKVATSCVGDSLSAVARRFS